MVEDSPYPGQAGIQDPALEDKHKAGRERDGEREVIGLAIGTAVYIPVVHSDQPSSFLSRCKDPRKCEV